MMMDKVVYNKPFSGRPKYLGLQIPTRGSNRSLMCNSDTTTWKNILSISPTSWPFCVAHTPYFGKQANQHSYLLQPIACRYSEPLVTMRASLNRLYHVIMRLSKKSVKLIRHVLLNLLC